MQRIRFLTFFTISFVLGTGALFAFLYHMGLFEVRAIPVELVSGQTDAAHPENQMAADKKLQGRIEGLVQDLRGKKIWEIDLSKMKAAIAHDEWVKDVLISRVLPNQVRVLVRSKEISLLFLNKQNEFYPVTDGGAFLSALPRGSMPEVPVLRGEIFVKEPQRRAEMVKFIRALSDNGPMGIHNVSEIGWASDDGYTLTLIQPKVDVKLGEEKLDLKAMRVAQVLNYLSANNLKGRVIDASFSKKVLVRLRKGP